MATIQVHRGPDDQGIWHKENVGLGHVRLSIIDLSPLGRQPMTNEDHSVWITFNGEIYNFLELRHELQQKGHQFRSRTDTEVIVHLWEEEGVRCVDRLRGMFAFAIWDDRQKVLFLARDRLGKKPLFYAMLPDRFLFGSEIKAILQDPDFRPEPDLQAIHYYLTYQSVPSPYSAFRSIHKLPPAHYLLVKGGTGVPRRYWKLSYKDQFTVDGARAEQNLQEELIERLREAVRLRLVSDVPLGAFLSGGLDSSMVVALMAGICNHAVKTFSIGFAQEEYNEAQYARIVADRYQTDHHEFQVTPDAKAIFPELVWHYNEPFADDSAIPTYYLSKLARQHVTVVLNGDGGDENFAGYFRYALLGQFDITAGIFPMLRQWLGEVWAWQAFARQQHLWKDPKALMSFSPRLLPYYWVVTQIHELHQAYLYTDNMKAATAPYPAFKLMLEKYRSSDAHSFLDALLNLDMELFLPETLMVKVDIASMAHSLETRAPMLDHHFLEFVAKIPANLKLKKWQSKFIFKKAAEPFLSVAKIPANLKLKDGWLSKFIFKKAAEPFLSEEIIHRPKMGFGVPTDHWFRHELKEMVHDNLLSPRALGRGYFRRESLERMLFQHQTGKSNWQYLIWNLLMLELWHQMFIDRTLTPPVQKPA
jgi:asparagine synthase (glutamine-hydrolysing)